MPFFPVGPNAGLILGLCCKDGVIGMRRWAHPAALARQDRAIRSNSSQKGRPPFLLWYFREPKIRRILVNYPLRVSGVKTFMAKLEVRPVACKTAPSKLKF
jgi:hypothetical protein